jgi:hypothetical protein
LPGIEQLVVFLLFGLLSGILGGFFGVGGGTIYVPVLTAFYAEHAHLGAPFVAFVIGNSLFLTLLSGASGSFKQYRLQNFYWKETMIIGLAGGASAVLVSMALTSMPWYDKSTFSWFFTLILLPMVVRMFWKRNQAVGTEQQAPRSKLLGIGLASGCVSALTGLGGGVVMVPLLSEWLKLPMRKATSLSLGAIVVMASSSVAWYVLQEDPPLMSEWQWGMIALPAVVPMGVGVLLAAPLGVKWGNKVKPAWSKSLFLVFFILVILQMHFRLFY